MLFCQEEVRNSVGSQSICVQLVAELSGQLVLVLELGLILVVLGYPEVQLVYLMTMEEGEPSGDHISLASGAFQLLHPPQL